VTDRVALVTGASGGIGAAAARRLSADGYPVGVHYAGNRAAAETVVAEIVAAGGRAVAVGGDVADEVAMAEAFDRVEAEFGGIDVIVNSAGIMPLAPIAEMDLAVFDRIVRTNLRGAFVVSQLAARRVREGGAIINVSTSVTRLRFPGYGPYAATKSGVETLTEILARELRGRNVTANVVAPGPTETPLFTNGKTEEEIARSAQAAPLGRLGQPDDIAATIAFLAAPGGWVNGQVVFANGGII
jgi:3-oxoacyl-[acyl-carrier protein] reductase